MFQSIIVQMKDATARTIGVVDSEGTVVASSDLSAIGSNIGLVPVFSDETIDNTVKSQGRTFRALTSGAGNGCAVFAEGDDDLAKTICVMAAVAVNEAGIYYEENNDKRAFVKSIISENILPGDMYARASELRFETDVVRGVLVIRHDAAMGLPVVELLVDLFSDKQHDFIISVNDSDIALIKEMPPLGDIKYLHDLAEMLKRKLDNDLGLHVVIGIGTPAQNLRELAIRFKEAQIAIEVGKVFESEKTIIGYESLGIGRLIYQLPTTLCEIFLSEVFKKNPIGALDKETLFTIDKFFENSLNVSETSRKLFVHRNTLVYRLEKIKKITGLDLREFDHAIIFKVALMVKKYLVSQESKYQ